MENLNKQTIGTLLCDVQKPARYTGGERNQVVKTDALIRMAISYPDLYEIGMSNQGISVLYELANRIEGVACERVFAVADDFEERIRELDLSLYTLETYTPLSQLDLLGFNISHELLYTNILQILELGKIPLLQKDRTESDPIVIAGGDAVSNPMPMSDFIDMFFIGEGEDGITEIITVVKKAREDAVTRENTLQLLSQLEGVYVPSIHSIGSLTETGSSGEIRIKKRIYRSHEPVVPIKPVVPNIRIAHERVVVEVTRGCGNLCKFCHAGYFKLPVRNWPAETAANAIMDVIKGTGYNEVSLASLSVSDYRFLTKLLNLIMPDLIRQGISISFPSLRVDSRTIDFLEHITDIRRTSLTFAVESACDELREIANKKVEIQDLLEIVGYAFSRGWRRIKLYFMIGLPGCEEYDEAEAIVKLLDEIRRISKKRVELNVTISPFVPKPHTPFQWAKMMDADYFYDIVSKIKRQVHRAVTIKSHNIKSSLLEGVMARGDARLGRVISAAFADGCKFDSWKESFRFDKWEKHLDSILPEWRGILDAREEEETLPWSIIDAGYEKLVHFQKDKEFSAKKVSRETSETLAVDSYSKAFELFCQRYEKKKTLRLTCSKRDMARYIPHIDFMEILKRGLRMADAPVVFTQGFNKREKIAMGFPLPLGVESIAELVDVELYDDIDINKVSAGINRNLPQGISVIDADYMESKESLMAITAATEYIVGIMDDVLFKKLAEGLASGPDFTKKSKKGVEKRAPFSEVVLEYKMTRMEEFPESHEQFDIVHDLTNFYGALLITLTSGRQNSLRIDHLIYQLTSITPEQLCRFTMVKCAQYRTEEGNLVEIR